MSDTVLQIKKIRVEEALLCLALLTFPLDTLVSLTGFQSVGDEGLTLTRLFVMLSMGLYVSRALWTKDTTLFSSMFDNAVTEIIICYFVVSLLSMATSRTPTNAIDPIVQRITVFLFYYLVINVIRDRRMLRLGMAAFVAGSVFTVAAGCLEMITNEAVISEVHITESLISKGLYTEQSGSIRVQGLSTDPSIHGVQLVTQLGLLFYFLVTAPSRKVRILLGVLLLLVMANIGASGSRSTWLASFLGVFLFVGVAPLRYKSRVFVGIAGAGVLAFIGLLVFFPNIAVLERIWGKQTYSPLGLRVELTRASLTMGRQNPLLGVGEGSFQEEFHRFAQEAPSMSGRLPPLPHNVYLCAVAEVGLVGLTVVCLLHLAVALQIITNFCRAPDMETKIMAAGLLASWLGFWVCLNFNPLWANKYGWTVMGFAGALARVLRAERETQQNGNASALQPDTQRNGISSPWRAV